MVSAVIFSGNGMGLVFLVVANACFGSKKKIGFISMGLQI